MLPVVRDRAGRGHSIYDNVRSGEIWIINDEDPEKINAIYHASTLQHQLTMWRTWRAHNRKQNRVNHRTPIHL